MTPCKKVLSVVIFAQGGHQPVWRIPPVRFQVDPASVPSIPLWMEEGAAVAHILTQTGIISAIEDHVQCARARFGTYDTIDFVIVLFSYALSGEPTIAAFYDRLAPFTHDFLALFHRHQLPSRSALSRFLAALDEKTVEALRTQFLQDLLVRATPFTSLGGVWDRLDRQYVVVDVDGTRQVARQRAFLTSQRCLSRIVVLLKSLHLATQAANAEKWYGRAPRSFNHIPINGSARLGDLAMGTCAKSYGMLAWWQPPMRPSISFTPPRS